MSSGCFQTKTQPFCILHSPVSSVMCPPDDGSAITGGDTRVFLSVSMACRSFLLSAPNVFGRGFFQTLAQRRRHSGEAGYKSFEVVAYA